MLREYGAQHSLLIASSKGMLEAVAARIAAGDVINDQSKVQCTSVSLYGTFYDSHFIACCVCVRACVYVFVFVCVNRSFLFGVF